MISRFRSLLFTVIFFVGSALLMLLAPILMVVSRKHIPSLAYKWSSFHLFCARLILNIDIRVEGEMPKEPVLIAMKHESMFETIDLPRLFKMPAIFAKKQLFKIPIWGPAARVYGNIPVDRDGGAGALRAMLKEAKMHTDAGRQLLIFPEGTRVEHGQKPELRSGFAGLYKILKLPVIPVAVNSGLLSPHVHGSWQKGIVTYRIGKPIPTGLSREEVETRVHEAINVLNQDATLD